MTYLNVRIFDNFSSIMHFNNWRLSPILSPSQLPPTQKCLWRPFCADMVLTQFCMVVQLDPTDWYIKEQKLLYKVDNSIGRKNVIICYMLCTNNIAKNTK